MSSLFISDLHLDPSRADSSLQLQTLLRSTAGHADALYILGDLFEVWLGDDQHDPLSDAVALQLRTVADSGVPVYFICGNRDFLLGDDYADRCGMRRLPDPSVVDLYGEPTLLLHGDLLCTDDAKYQAFRQQVRDPLWQNAFLAQSLAARRQFAEQARAASAEHQAGAGELITDVNDDCVRAMFSRFGVRRMIHGHTHRPADISLDVDDRPRQRCVLADWYQRGEGFWIHPDGQIERCPVQDAADVERGA